MFQLYCFLTIQFAKFVLYFYMSTWSIVPSDFILNFFHFCTDRKWNSKTLFSFKTFNYWLKYKLRLKPDSCCLDERTQTGTNSNINLHHLYQGWPNHCRGQKSACQNIFKCPLNFFENWICWTVLRILKHFIEKPTV